MACYYVYDKEIGAVLIPECIAVAVSNDKDLCTCWSYYNFEKERYQVQTAKMKESIKDLSTANQELIKQIKMLENEIQHLKKKNL